MISTRCLLAAIALPLAIGCAQQDAPEAPTLCESPEVAPKAMRGNGIMLNAHTLNGVMLNAWNNGVALNAWNSGTALDGAELIQGVVVGDAGEEILAVGNHGSEIALTITEVEQDGDVSYLQLALPDGSNVCGPGGKGLIVPGVWDYATGARHASMQLGAHQLQQSFSCTTGVIAKCVMWGYAPELHGADVHQTCTRLARADYCGDGVPHTENGTPIDVYDGLGILEPEGGMDFEAGWGPDGAVCVNHPRYLDIVVGDGPVYPSCWSELPQCDDRAGAEDHDALLVNASTQRERTWCSAAEVPAG